MRFQGFGLTASRITILWPRPGIVESVSGLALAHRRRALLEILFFDQSKASWIEPQYLGFSSNARNLESELLNPQT